MSVADFRAKVALATAVPVPRQRLIYRGKLLKDGVALAAYDLQDGHTVHLVAKPPANSATSSTTQTANEDARQREVNGPAWNLSNLRSALRRTGATTTTQPLPMLREILDEMAESPQEVAEGMGLGGLNGPRRQELAVDLEPITQGILTMRTVLSTAVQEQEEQEDERIEEDAQVEQQTDSHTTTQRGPRQFFVGQWLDVKDTVNQWLESTVMAIADGKVLIHYHGWPTRWDEWIDVESDRIAAFRTRTLHTQNTQRMSPVPTTRVPSAPRVGDNDVRRMVVDVRNLMREMLPHIDRLAGLCEEDLRREQERGRAQNEAESDNSSTGPSGPTAPTTLEPGQARESEVSEMAHLVAPLFDRFGRLLVDSAGYFDPLLRPELRGTSQRQQERHSTVLRRGHGGSTQRQAASVSASMEAQDNSLSIRDLIATSPNTASESNQPRRSIDSCPPIGRLSPSQSFKRVKSATTCSGPGTGDFLSDDFFGTSFGHEDDDSDDESNVSHSDAMQSTYRPPSPSGRISSPRTPQSEGSSQFSSSTIGVIPEVAAAEERLRARAAEGQRDEDGHSSDNGRTSSASVESSSSSSGFPTFLEVMRRTLSGVRNLVHSEPSSPTEETSNPVELVSGFSLPSSPSSSSISSSSSLSTPPMSPVFNPSNGNSMSRPRSPSDSSIDEELDLDEKMPNPTSRTSAEVAPLSAYRKRSSCTSGRVSIRDEDVESYADSFESDEEREKIGEGESRGGYRTGSLEVKQRMLKANSKVLPNVRKRERERQTLIYYDQHTYTVISRLRAVNKRLSHQLEQQNKLIATMAEEKKQHLMLIESFRTEVQMQKQALRALQPTTPKIHEALLPAVPKPPQLNSRVEKDENSRAKAPHSAVSPLRRPPSSPLKTPRIRTAAECQGRPCSGRQSQETNLEIYMAKLEKFEDERKDLQQRHAHQLANYSHELSRLERLLEKAHAAIQEKDNELRLHRTRQLYCTTPTRPSTASAAVRRRKSNSGVTIAPNGENLQVKNIFSDDIWKGLLSLPPSSDISTGKPLETLSASSSSLTSMSFTFHVEVKLCGSQMLTLHQSFQFMARSLQRVAECTHIYQLAETLTEECRELLQAEQVLVLVVDKSEQEFWCRKSRTEDNAEKMGTVRSAMPHLSNAGSKNCISASVPCGLAAFVCHTKRALLLPAGQLMKHPSYSVANDNADRLVTHPHASTLLVRFYTTIACCDRKREKYLGCGPLFTIVADNATRTLHNWHSDISGAGVKVYQRSAQKAAAGMTIHFGQGIVGLVAEAQEAINIPDAYDDPRRQISTRPDSAWCGSSHQQVWRCSIPCERRVFTPNDSKLIALAIENSQLFQRNQELCWNVGKLIADGDLVEAIVSLGTAAEQIIGVEGAAVYVVDPDTQELVTFHHKRRHRIALSEATYAGSLMEEAVRSQQLTIVNDMAKTGSFNAFVDSLNGISARNTRENADSGESLSVDSGQKMVGLLQLVNTTRRKTHFDQHDLFLSIVQSQSCSVLAAILEKQRMLRQKEQIALLLDASMSFFKEMSVVGVINAVYNACVSIFDADTTAHLFVWEENTHPVDKMLERHMWSSKISPQAAAALAPHSSATNLHHQVTSMSFIPSLGAQSRKLSVVMDQTLRAPTSEGLLQQVLIRGSAVIVKQWIDEEDEEDSTSKPSSAARRERPKVDNYTMKGMRSDVRLGFTRHSVVACPVWSSYGQEIVGVLVLLFPKDHPAVAAGSRSEQLSTLPILTRQISGALGVCHDLVTVSTRARKMQNMLELSRQAPKAAASLTLTSRGHLGSFSQPVNLCSRAFDARALSTVLHPIAASKLTVHSLYMGDEGHRWGFQISGATAHEMSCDHYVQWIGKHVALPVGCTEAQVFGKLRMDLQSVYTRKEVITGIIDTRQVVDEDDSSDEIESRAGDTLSRSLLLKLRQLLWEFTDATWQVDVARASHVLFKGEKMWSKSELEQALGDAGIRWKLLNGINSTLALKKKTVL
ncbi:Ubiquitin-related domain [Phytophthora cactorum]|nr:Ubiquitin-related domain [Phytophthora cactorum]